MLKIVLKAGLKKAPGFGFVMQTLGFLFLERDWAKDQLHMENMCQAYAARQTQLLIFPEGTDLSPSNLEKSQAFAEKNGLPVMKHVLVPRSKGFVCCLKKLRSGSCQALYDLTLAFPDKVPQSEKTILEATWPQEIHIHVERHELSALPMEDAAVEQWVFDTFLAKERRLELFATNKQFAAAHRQYEDVKPSSLATFALIFWALATMAFVYLLVMTSWYLYFCLVALVVQHAVTLAGGIDKMDLSRWMATRSGRPKGD